MKSCLKNYVTSALALILSITCTVTYSPTARADDDEPELHSQFKGTADWSNFDKFMHDAEKQDEQIGWSYLASGILVTLGGTLGSQYATDDATRVVYGITSALGLGASAYGLDRLFNGNNYTDFYESLKASSLTDLQRSELVSHFIANEKAKEVRRKRIAMITNLVMAGLNIYSGTQDTDKNTKNFFYAFAGVNLGLALSYSF